MTDQINLQYTTLKAPLPDFIYEDIKNFSNGANAYKPQPEELVSMLAKKHGLQNENIYLTAGIDEALQMFIKKYAGIGITFSPHYIVYGDIEIFGGIKKTIDSVKDGKYSIEPKHYEGDIIFIANPNNPMGWTEKEEIIKLIENNKDKVVVVDEAYGEFAPELSVIDQVKNYSNLAVLRSFSKDYSMAGNRMGYIIANPELIASVKDFTQWSNISYLSVGAAISALNHEDYFKNLREEIIKNREELSRFLLDLGFKVLPSKINALLIQFEDENFAQKFIDVLLDNNVIVSHGNGNSNIGLDKSFVRIAIGTKEQLEVLKSVVRKYNEHLTLNK